MLYEVHYLRFCGVGAPPAVAARRRRTKGANQLCVVVPKAQSSVVSNPPHANIHFTFTPTPAMIALAL